jgi:hypothetical protein
MITAKEDMKTQTKLGYLAIVIGSLIATSAMAASDDYCGPDGLIQQKVNQAMQDRLRASAPTEAPSTYVQNNYDIKGILAQDVSSGFTKLFNFSGISNSILDYGISTVSKNASSTFNTQINGVLGKYGAGAVQMPSYSGSIATSTVSASTMSTVDTSTATPGIAPATQSSGFILGPYERIKSAISSIF